MKSLPRYKSHKVVEALRIENILESVKETATWYLEPVGNNLDPVPVSDTYVKKHAPKPGGYYVRYPDGYESWSPAEAFEDGYTLVDG